MKLISFTMILKLKISMLLRATIYLNNFRNYYKREELLKRKSSKLRVVSKGIDRNAVKQEIDKASERLNQSLRNSDESQYMKNFKFKKLEDFYDKEFKEVH